ncbi:MAG: hypothetical protein WCR67_07860 [Bacilli bacterium]
MPKIKDKSLKFIFLAVLFAYVIFFFVYYVGFLTFVERTGISVFNNVLVLIFRLAIVGFLIYTVIADKLVIAKYLIGCYFVYYLVNTVLQFGSIGYYSNPWEGLVSITGLFANIALIVIVVLESLDKISNQTKYQNYILYLVYAFGGMSILRRIFSLINYVTIHSSWYLYFYLIAVLCLDCAFVIGYLYYHMMGKKEAIKAEASDTAVTAETPKASVAEEAQPKESEAKEEKAAEETKPE